MEINCSVCNGDGWYMDHMDKCYQTGECDGTQCPIQRQCENCSGTGKVQMQDIDFSEDEIEQRRRLL